MGINVLALGSNSDLHYFQKTNVNSEDNYIYFKNEDSPTAIPAALTTGTGFIYRSGVGALTGITTTNLVFAKVETVQKLKFTTDAAGTIDYDITAAVAGSVTFNKPYIYTSILNIDSSTATNQAVKYYTAGTPLTGLTSGNTYFLKNVSASAFSGSQALYSIASNTHTFTTAGVTGRVGPTITQVRTAYTGATAWSGTYLQQGNFQGYQDWTVPVSGIYEFTVNGASGYNGSGAGGVGRGATVKGRVSLTKGEIITIAVGQVGAAPSSGTTWGGSGGGTFVVRKTGFEPLFIAGGGSGESGATIGRDGALTQLGGRSTNNAIAGGLSGFGGVSTGGYSAGGGGFNSRGQNTSELGGGSFLDGLTMSTNGRVGGFGGFGGGAQSDGNIAGQSGGGGGYSGGGGSRSTLGQQSGGGGGSFITTTATNVATSTGLFDGSGLFNGNAIINLSSYNTGEGSVVMSIVSTFTSGNEVYPTAADSEAGTNKISIAAAGSSYHSFVPINFDDQNDLIHSSTVHGLSNGEAVILNFNGTAPAGLVNGTTYYINTVNNFTYRLSTTPSPTYTTINLTTPSTRETATSSTISRVVVNITQDTLTISSHGFQVDQPLIYSAGGGTAISPLVDGSTYYVQEVIDANRIRLKLNLNSVTYINFTSAGTGTSHSFIFSTINAATDEIYIANHGLVDGQAVRYSNGGGTTIPGLTNNTTYYIKTSDRSLIRLALTSALNTFANITGPGTGTQSLLITALDYVNDKITLPSHGFLAGELVLYDAKGQTVVNGLTTATPYYIIFEDQDNIKLATTPENAIAGTAINITDTPAGVGRHTLQSLSKTPDGIYNITSLPGGAPTTFTATAQGQVPLIVKTFNPRATIDVPQNAFIIPSHGFLTGTKVTYSKGAAATVISGLIDATDYYVVAINKDYLRLASTAENAAAGTVVTVTDYGTGVGHSFTTAQINGNVTGAGSVTISSGSVLVTGNGTQFTKILKVGDRFRLFPPNVTKSHGSVQFAAADINTGTDQIAKAHTLPTGQAVVFSAGGGTAPTGLVEGTTYFARAVSTTAITLHTTFVGARDNSAVVDITAAGTGTAFTLTASTINLDLTFAAADINTTSDVITKSHPFTTGTQVIFSNGGGTSPTGLVNGDSYFVRNTSFTSFTLHTTAAGAAANTDLVDITAAGTGLLFRLFADQTDFSAVNVDTTTNRIVRSHSFVTGDTAKFSAGGGVAPSPLVDGYYYFVRAISATEISLHGSAADATSNTSPADFSTTGTGSLFTLTKTTAVGPIIRRIAAIGSDTQISVDRPYSSAYTAASYSYPTFIYVRPEGYSLHRPFDGGVEMSAGANTSFATIVRQTRKYFRYQSGKGLQTSCGINFKPSIDIETMLKINSNTIECTTRRPHGLINDLFVKISEAKDSAGVTSTVYNGEFQVSIPSGSLTKFRITKGGGIPEDRAYGFPQFYVREWSGGAVRTGMFDFQNGMFFEFDGQKIYACRRSSTQQMAGTVSALQGNEVIFGTGTSFQAQLVVGDYVVMRGQSYRVTQIDSQTRMSVRPEYKGSSGTEKEFNPATVVNTSTDVFTIVGHGFSDILPVVYNSIDGEPIGGLVNGRTYYISVLNGNTFKLKASPDSGSFVNLSSVGTTTVHSFTPAKSGIIVTKTVDTKIPQEDWSIDPCDGTGATGYNLDLSRIQMAYMDYSWYGAGKIRFGFKTTDGQVQYVHEFVHNNNLFESYFRSGNLPARYEVVTYANPTYIPSLFHWGTSVMMDGRFDDDNAYLFTQNSQTLDIRGTTAKSFASSGINLTNDLITVQTHGFRTGDTLQFESIGSNGLRGANSLHPTTRVVGSNSLSVLTNGARYKTIVNSANLLHLSPLNATITVGATFTRTSNVMTVVTSTNHGLSTGMYVGIYGVTNTVLNGAQPATSPTGVANGAFTVTVTNATTFTYPSIGTNQSVLTEAGAVIGEVIDFSGQGNTQFTYFLYPDGSLNNTSGPNYQPLISLRLSPSVSEGLTGKLGDRDVINRMQLRLKEIGISSTNLVDVKVLLNPRLNNLNFTGVDAPSLTQVVEHTAADTVSGGVQVYNFRGSGGSGGVEGTTTVDVSTLFEMSNSILGGDSIFPDGPDIITIAVARLTGNSTLTAAKLTWSEAQA
jgi:ribosomal protein L31